MVANLFYTLITIRLNGLCPFPTHLAGWLAGLYWFNNMTSKFDIVLAFPMPMQMLYPDALTPCHLQLYQPTIFQVFRTRGYVSFKRRDSDLADLIEYLVITRLPDKDSIARSLSLTIDDYSLSEDGLLFHIWTPRGHRRAITYQQLVIPTALRYEVLTWAHDHPMAGHLGTLKTYEKLRLRYYWRNMFSDTQHWCRSCCDCAMRKSPRNRHKAPLMPIPVQDAWDRVACQWASLLYNFHRLPHKMG